MVISRFPRLSDPIPTLSSGTARFSYLVFLDTYKFRPITGTRLIVGSRRHRCSQASALRHLPAACPAYLCTPCADRAGRNTNWWATMTAERSFPPTMAQKGRWFGRAMPRTWICCSISATTAAYLRHSTFVSCSYVGHPSFRGAECEQKDMNCKLRVDPEDSHWLNGSFWTALMLFSRQILPWYPPVLTRVTCRDRFLS